MFHSENSLESLIVDVFKNIFIVHLSRSGLIASRIIPDLKIGDLIITEIDIVDDISGITLDVIHIEKYFAGRAVDCFANGISLVGRSQEEIRGIAQWFKHHYDLVR